MNHEKYFHFDDEYDCWVKIESEKIHKNNYKELIAMMDIFTVDYIGKNIKSMYDLYKYWNPFDSDAYTKIDDNNHDYWTYCACGHDIVYPFEVYLIDNPSIKVRIGSHCILKFSKIKNDDNETSAQLSNKDRFMSELEKIMAKRSDRICKECKNSKIDKRKKSGKEQLCVDCYRPINIVNTERSIKLHSQFKDLNHKNKLHGYAIINSTIDNPEDREILYQELDFKENLDSYKPFYENYTLIEIYNSKGGIEHIINSMTKSDIKKITETYNRLKMFIQSKLENDKDKRKEIFSLIKKYNIKCFKIIKK